MHGATVVAAAQYIVVQELRQSRAASNGDGLRGVFAAVGEVSLRCSSREDYGMDSGWISPKETVNPGRRAGLVHEETLPR